MAELEAEPPLMLLLTSFSTCEVGIGLCKEKVEVGEVILKMENFLWLGC